MRGGEEIKEGVRERKGRGEGIQVPRLSLILPPLAARTKNREGRKRRRRAVRTLLHLQPQKEERKKKERGIKGSRIRVHLKS